MSKNIKKSLLLILIVISSLWFKPTVFAKEITINTDKNDVTIGDTITLSVQLDEDTSLYAIKAKFSYDKDVFTVLNEESFIEDENIKEVIYNEESNEFIVLNKSGVSDKNLLQVQLKVKDNALTGNTKLNLSDFEISDGKESTSFTDKSVSINVKGTNITNNESEDTKTTTSKTSTKKTFNLKKSLLFSCIALIILMLLLILINSNLNNITKENKRKASIIIAIIIVIIDALLIILNCFNSTSKGDVNKDGKKDYDDVRKISEYLLNIVNEVDTKEEATSLPLKYYNADYNNDGKLTLDDVANLTEDLKEQVTYDVNIKTPTIKNYYVSKKGTLELNLNIAITPSDKIAVEGVYIDNTYYKVTAKEENIYTLKLPMPNKAGIYEPSISKVKLTNGNVIELEPVTFKVDILKTKPSIKNFTILETDGKINISFDMNDSDDALSKSFLLIKTSDKEVLRKEIVKGHNTFSLSLDKGLLYNASIIATYDLDSDKDNAKNEYKDEVLLSDKNFEIYNADISLASQSKTYLEKNEELTISLNAFVSPNANIKEVIINNKKYQVEKTNSNYLVKIKAPSEAKSYKYKVSAIVLDNDVMLNSNLDINFTVLKDKPNFTDVKYNNKQITFNLVDKDKALIKAKLEVINKETNEKVLTKDIDITKSNFTYACDLSLGGTYYIKITGDYDLDSTKTKEYYYEDYEFYSSDETVAKATIKPLNDINNLYPNQNEKITFAFDVDILPATNLKVTKVIFDGSEKDVLIKDNHYVIEIPASNKPGSKEHKITGVILENNTKLLCNYTVKYDVLKKSPTIKDFVYSDKTNKITFNLEDNDKSLTNAKIVVTNQKTNATVLEQALTLTKTSFEYPVNLKKGAKYTVKIVGTYDLDSTKENGKNEYKNISLYTYELNIYDVKLSHVNNETTYVNKNTEMTLSFKATILPEDSSNLVTAVIMDGKTYDVVANQDGIYTITLTSPATACEKKYTITSVVFGNMELSSELSFNVEVLKDAPTISDLLIDETKKNPTLTFTINDSDSALDETTPGYAYIAKENSTDVTKIAIKKGKNEIDLSNIVKDEETYYLDIKVNYDLDFSKNNKHEENDYVLLNSHIIKLYKVSLQADKNNKYYVAKEENVPFKINARINLADDLKIKTLIMDDGTTYEAKLNDNLYTINLKMPNKAGLKTYKITKVILENDIEVNSALEITFDILKDVPYINKFNFSEENSEFSFNLVDKDKAFQSGTVAIYDDNNEVVKTSTVSAKTTIKYKFQEDRIYNIKVFGNYNTDSDVKDENNYYENTEMFTHSIMIGGDYNFELTNASITDSLQKNEKPVISFTSSNTKNASITKVTINSKDYDITKQDGNYYEVVLTDAKTTAGKHTVTIDKVLLSTMKTFTNKEDFTVNALSYNILKEKPSVKNIKLTSNNDNKTVTATFNFVDKDITLVRLTALLVDSADRIVSSQVLSPEELYLYDTPSVTLSYQDSVDGHVDGYYKVRFLADYNLDVNKYKYTDQNIGEASILTQKDLIYIKDIYITNGRNQTIDNIYPAKGEKNYQIAFDVYVDESINAYARAKYGNRAYQKVSVVTVNGVNYNADAVSGYKSKITLNVPATSGVINLTVNRVQLEYADYNVSFRQFYSVPEASIKIDVLKDIPKIENLQIKEDYAKKEATFDFDVVLDKKAEANDESFKEGSIKLGEESQAIKRGHNSITFKNIEQNKNYDLTFLASYDLDTDTLGDTDKNEYANVEIHKVNYGLYEDKNYQNIKITDGQAISKDNDKYFEKNENIKLNFAISGLSEELGLTPEKVVIKDKEYSLTKENDFYQITLNGYNTFGEKTITITDIILNNGKKVTLKNAYSIKPEVLKDAVKLTDYTYETKDNKVTVKTTLKDYDAALVGKANIKITDEAGKVLVNKPYAEEVTFTKTKSLRYYVLIEANYDRDIDITEDSPNYYKNVKLLEEIISYEENNIELKDINDINLFKLEKVNNENTISLKDEVDVSDLQKNLTNYFVEVNMETMPTVRAKIKSVTTKDNELILTLDYTYLTKENDKSKEVNIVFGTINNDVATNETHPDAAFKALLNKLANNEDVTLKQNYDASLINEDTKYYVDTYTAKLDGNGFTIKNLQKPLFNKINGGTVKNLNLENVTLDGTARGSLANEATLANINGVIVNGVKKASSNEGRNGGLIGNTANNTTIENCAVKNVSLNGGGTQQNAGLIGYAEYTTVKNTYVTGAVSSWHNFSAGFIANSNNCTITKSYAKVNVSGPISCNFGCSYVGASAYENNISLGTGGNNGFANKATRLFNNFHLVNEKVESTIENVTNITKEEVNANLFKKANFDTEIWSLDDINYDNTPIFHTEKVNELNDTSNENYDENKRILYNNLIKLMPYYDSEKIIESAKNVTDKYLNTKEIMHIIPVDKNGNIVTYLTTEDVKKISKIKIVYKTQEKSEYNVIYDNTYDFVVTYRIPDLKIDYNYTNYLINANSQVVNDLTNYLAKLNYTDNLDILTSTPDSRIYKDFYNETTSKELREFVLKFLSNTNYTNTSNDEDINDYLEQAVKENQTIEKVLYMYNYFRRFYDVEIDGMKLYDFMLFNMQGFNKNLTPTFISDIFLKDSANFNTNETNTRYANLLGTYTNLNTISKFLEYMVTEFSTEDMNNWVRNQFKGYLAEVPVKDHPDVQYTLWDHFSNEDAKYHPYQVYNYILPILTLPENAAYIISSPAQFIIGAQRTYIVNPDDKAEQELLQRKVASYTERMSNYYNTAYSILQDSKVFNDIHTYQIDKRYTKGANGETIFHNPYATEEPFHKNFNEVLNQWAYNDYNAATANGTAIIWRVEGLMDGNLIPELGNVQTYTYETWAHETAHNIDARLFLRDNGRRYDAGGEDYADGNLTQSFGQNDIVMNLSLDYAPETRIGANLKPSRVSSPSKIYDFYKKVFQTLYIMDYIEGKAFLELTDEEKSGIAVQVMYPDENIPDESCTDGKCTNQVYLKYKTTVYQHITKDKYEQMQLNSLADLYKERLVIFPSVYYSTYGANRYGGEGINKARWYQPNNPYGRPDSYSIKWLAYEMLGYKGYNDGYIEYYSNINANSDGSKNDIMALKKITGYNDFAEYKNARFTEVEEKLAYINKAIDINDYLQKFYEAMKEDALYANQKIKEAWEKYPESLTDDASVRARGNLLSSAKVATNSTKVRYDLYYTLKNATNDFEDNVYMNQKQQDVSKFHISK